MQGASAGSKEGLEVPKCRPNIRGMGGGGEGSLNIVYQSVK